MQIRKVKVAAGVIIIRAEEQSGEDDVRRIELESRAEPRPEFHEAMGGLILPAMRMIQAPGHWIVAATISGVSITHEEERGMGAVVTLLVPLECASSPLVINTPYLISYLTGEGVGAPVLPDDLRQAIERVIDEAVRYLNGDRAQGDLFAERPGDVPVDKFFEGMNVYREHDADGVVEELEPAHIVAGKLVVGSAHLAEEMNEPADGELANADLADGPIRPPVGVPETNPAAEPEPLSDGPSLDRPPHQVRAEFEQIRAKVMRKQPVIKPARGRRAVKAET